MDPYSLALLICLQFDMTPGDSIMSFGGIQNLFRHYLYPTMRWGYIVLDGMGLPWYVQVVLRINRYYYPLSESDWYSTGI